ncbi:hypothetical protein Z043_103203 [Scleropages formosus]|uniref:PH domain-containing protein n=1 Tax=Scleropages formosus TaxID=113540 RepID=A0A0P7VTH8_SCLFO|nr:hypothetical protein Z043_103203 [Scleropages formosus]
MLEDGAELLIKSPLPLITSNWSGQGGVRMFGLEDTNQLSGYLLRKFKNSNGWQKLWVVFTNFCLFFYKTHQVEKLLGRSVSSLLSSPISGLICSSEKQPDPQIKAPAVCVRVCVSVCPFTAQDDYPLASLPLLGYTVSTPGETDSIHKEFVFKLQWMEVIKSAANAPGRMSLLVPKDTLEISGN